MFNSVSKYKHSKDQLQTIEKFVEDIKNGKKEQVLLGATGTGKTFTIANVIKKVNKPTLFESFINSCINMCELIDYIGYYPSTRQGKILKWKI